MDLSIAEPNRLASMVMSGKLQLGEIPMSNRSQVEQEIARIIEERKAAQEEQQSEGEANAS